MINAVMRISENLKKLTSASSNSLEQTYEMMYKELEVFKTMFLSDIEPKYMILLGVQVSTIAEKISGFSSKKVKTKDYLDFLNKINKSYIKTLEVENDVYLDNVSFVEPTVMLYKVLAETLKPSTVYLFVKVWPITTAIQKNGLQLLMILTMILFLLHGLLLKDMVAISHT